MNLKGIRLTWLGHATFRIETPPGRTILVDPWVMGNPMCPEKEKDVKKVDVLLCTHGHFRSYRRRGRDRPMLTGKPSDLQKLVPGVEMLEMKPGATVS
jgi:L-ascorbate metabolism protein UlaG (beta-lactamase superfamily)